MDTLLCYFYSTIPQVLSGAIGLVGVFCLYKLNLIHRFLEGLTKSMVDEFKNNKETYNEKINDQKTFQLHINRLNTAATQTNLHKMQKALTDTYNFVKGFMQNTNMFEQIIEPFEHQMKTRKTLIKHTKIALIFTGLQIFLSVFIIPFIRSILTICPYSTITKYNCLALIFLIIMIALFLFNLIIIIMIVFRTIDTY